MTITHHEPIPIHYVEHYSPEEQADLNGATRAFVAITGRIKTLMGSERFGSASVVELHTFEPTEDAGVLEINYTEQSSQEARQIEESAEYIRGLIAESGEQGMSVDEFQAAAAAAGIDMKTDAVMQALIFGFDEGKFSIRNRDDRIVASPATVQLQDA